MKSIFKKLGRIITGDPVSDPGDTHPDGMVYAGYLQGRGAMYMAPAEGTLYTKWAKAVEHAAFMNTVRAFGHEGWSLPDLEQAALLAKHMDTINKRGEKPLLSGYFWTAAQGNQKPGANAYMKTFNGRDNPAHEEWVGNDARSLPVLIIPDKPDPTLAMVL